jgi:hypothetical protein
MRCDNCGIDYPSDYFPSSEPICNDCSAKNDVASLTSISKPLDKEESSLPVEISNLIACPDCGKEISKKATSCPNCGCPISGESNEKQEISSFSSFAIACICAGIIALFTPVIFINFIVITSVILGIFSMVKKEKLQAIAIIGIILSLTAFYFANKQMDEARSKINEAQRELEQLQRQLK